MPVRNRWFLFFKSSSSVRDLDHAFMVQRVGYESSSAYNHKSNFPRGPFFISKDIAFVQAYNTLGGGPRAKVHILYILCTPQIVCISS